MEVVEENIKPGYKQTKVGWIPKDWDLVSLDSLCSKISDGIHTTPVYSENTEYHFVNGNNLVNHTIVVNEKTKCVSLEEFEKHKRDLDSNSLLLSINGTIGNISFYNGEKVVLGKSAAYINCMNKSIRNYVFYIIQTQHTKYYFENELTGSTIRNLSLKSIRTTPIPIPTNTPEQQKIAQIISTWDKAISKTEELIAKKQERKKGLMQQLLTGKKRFKEFVKSDKMKETKLGWIPEDWEQVRLAEECDLITKGTTPSSIGLSFEEKGINFLKVESVKEDGEFLENRFAFISEETHEKLKRSQFKENDLVISIAGALGRVAIIKREILPANTNQALALVRLKDQSSINLLFLFHFLKSDRVKRHIDLINVQAAQANLSLKDIGNFKVLLPSIDEQKRITLILSLADKEIFNLQAKLKKLKEQKKGLMQKLLTGEVRVKTD